MASSDTKHEDKVQPQEVTNIESGIISKEFDNHVVDQAAQFLADTDETYAPLTPEQEKKLKRKIDRWMIPMLLFVATLGAVDKVELGTAAIYGFRTDNNLHGQQYSWLGSILPLGMLPGMFISSYLVHRLPTAKYLCFCSICWSILTLFYAACKSWGGFMVLRFLMGMFEAVISPAIQLIIAGFYKIHEQPPINAIILSCFSSVINGFWSWVVGQIPDSAPLAKWQYLFLITGSINVCYSIFVFIALPDSPMNAWFLTREEKYHAVQRLASNRTGIVNKTWKWSQVLESILDPKTWLVFLFNIAINIPNGGLITFGSIIINNLGFDARTSSLLSMPTGVMSTISGCTFAYLASRWKNRRCLCIAISALLPLLGTALVYGLPRSNTPGQMVGLYLMYCYWGPYVVCVSLPQANTAGYTKKTTSFSLLFLGYAAGNLIGPQTFRSDQAPAYTGGVIAMLTCYCGSILLVMAYWAVTAVQNKRKDQKWGRAEEVNDESLEGMVKGFQDETDWEQKGFRYTT
ncbi:MAG: hypothetical protein M1834_007837 [Cirrosporium novae-zelandiae]|nr:MAG: hypothetical protein M1834_007837 [Cirrosporium novae-zelandiae]